MAATSSRLYQATFSRLFAAAYDSFVMGPVEKKGLRDRRAALIARAQGATLELGAGTGLNLEFYPASQVTELTLTEPGEHMVRRLRERVDASPYDARVVQAPAEHVPFDDESFDTVIATLVLCTAPDPVAAIAETARVLRPGGRFLFLEHVRSDSPKTSRWQDRLAPTWRFLGDGCNLNRDTESTLRSSPLEVEELEHGEMVGSPPFIRPLISGVARKPTT
jgi:ubiquinone/menaquinone biosynthesis C-methylase UbiE